MTVHVQRLQRLYLSFHRFFPSGATAYFPVYGNHTFFIYIILFPGQPDNTVNGPQQNSSGDLEEMICADIAEHDTVSRFSMVCSGTNDLNNVLIVPSGPFILSKVTFPEYFIKEVDEDIAKNVENDITFFAERIAPHLNISYRFVGEEPEDMVTNEYNLAMKKILPQNGISLVEIPRKECYGRYISASSVRECLKNNDINSLNDLVPESTKRILFMKNC